MKSAIFVLVLVWVLPGLAQESAGKAVYDKYCSQCHGDMGDGEGYAAAFVLPKPRNFTTGKFKFRSTGAEYLPAKEDLVKVIKDGIYGTSMPSFSQIGDQAIDQVADYIQVFYKDRLEKDKQDGFWPPKKADLSGAPKITDQLIAKGRANYFANGCGDCHGFQGRADGPSSPTLEDDYGNPIRPANLRRSWQFRGGNRLVDIFRAFSTGLSGTPMPSYMDSISTEDRWALAAYVHDLSSETEPDAPPQVIAPQIDGALPDTVSDPQWDKAAAAYFPLTAQIIWEPVNIDPTVRSVSIRALHNGEELALLLEWDDPTFSLAGAKDKAQEEEDDFFDDGDDFFDEEEETAATLNDGLAVQFPSGIPKNNERPYFIFGESGKSVNLWRWTNGPALAEIPYSGDEPADRSRYYSHYGGSVTPIHQIAKGREQISDLSTGSPLTGQAEYLNGTYRLVIKRKLEGADSGEVQIGPGQFIPIAFWAWDGHNGEEGLKAACSAWYFLVLEKPIDQSVYIKTGVAASVMILLQLLAISMAKKLPAASGQNPIPVEAEPSE